MNICNYKPLRWQANMAPDINNRFKFVYRTLCHLQASTFEFLYGANDPLNDPGHTHAIYLNTTDGTIWDWNNVTQIWELIYTPTGGPGGTQDLQSVLDQGNTATLQTITLFGSDSHFTTTAEDSIASASIGVANEPFIDLTNSSNNVVRIRASLASNNTIQCPAGSGTLALLSDIPPATPTVISTKTTDYTLQLTDADFDTLFEMDAATDEDFIVDSAIAFPIGTSFIFARRGAGEVNIVAAGATVILSANGATNLTYQDSGATLIKVSATEWYLFGDIGAPITATPGGSDREIQFNDGGVAWGGATGFTYDPANTYGLVELVSTDDTKSLFSIQGPSTSANIFEVADEANPGLDNYFVVGANSGYMSGIWTISNGGKLTISTSSSGLQNMFVLNNALGTKNIAFALSDTNIFTILDSQLNKRILASDATTNSTSLGYNALNPLETGGSNNAFGKDSLKSVTNGTANMAGGASSLQNLTTGSFNAALGNGGGGTLTTGSYNTLLGVTSNVAASNTEYSIALGYNASAASNQLAISPNITQIKATGLTTAADRVLTDVAGNGILTLEPKRPYQVLIGNLTQTGTSAPVFTIFENTTGITFTTSYSSVGLYTLTANSGTPFTANKTQVFIGGNISTVGSDVYTINTDINSTTVIGISSASVSIGFDNGILTNTPIEIRIYP